MKEKITGIVLRIVRHSDKHNILTLYTESRGRMSCLSTAPGARSRLPRLMPLSIISAEINYSEVKEIQRLPSFSYSEIFPRIYSSPIKTSVALFLTEFLTRLLREASPDQQMWRFLTESLRIFDEMDEGVANFHIIFLSQISQYVGIQPDVFGYDANKVFDMRSGVYVDMLPSHRDYIVGEDARLPIFLSRLTYPMSKYLRFTSNQRAELLEKIIQYYAIHFPGMANISSHKILHQIFE
jgi:DNA repair protein RecO (recombination protein O)